MSDQVHASRSHSCPRPLPLMGGPVEHIETKWSWSIQTLQDQRRNIAMPKSNPRDYRAAVRQLFAGFDASADILPEDDGQDLLFEPVESDPGAGYEKEIGKIKLAVPKPPRII
ncbi:hypothetical protein AAE478_005719 [Parahypoxylon ruwenzoriense]